MYSEKPRDLGFLYNRMLVAEELMLFVCHKVKIKSPWAEEKQCSEKWIYSIVLPTDILDLNQLATFIKFLKNEPRHMFINLAGF